VLRRSRYERLSVQNRRFRSIGGQLTQNVKGVAPTNHSSSLETRQNDLSNGIKICTNFSSVLSQSTRLSDRQTDRRTDRILIAIDRACIPCNAVNIEFYAGALIKVLAVKVQNDWRDVGPPSSGSLSQLPLFLATVKLLLNAGSQINAGLQ